jgi:hypothetical protein
MVTVLYLSVLTASSQSIRCTFETRPGKGEMDIFIEPAEWPNNDLKPIAQLNVTATNYVDGFQLPGVHAISNLEKPCS